MATQTVKETRNLEKHVFPRISVLFPMRPADQRKRLVYKQKKGR